MVSIDSSAFKDVMDDGKPPIPTRMIEDDKEEDNNVIDLGDFTPDDSSDSGTVDNDPVEATSIREEIGSASGIGMGVDTDTGEAVETINTGMGSPTNTNDSTSVGNSDNIQVGEIDATSAVDKLKEAEQTLEDNLKSAFGDKNTTDTVGKNATDTVGDEPSNNPEIINTTTGGKINNATNKITGFVKGEAEGMAKYIIASVVAAVVLAYSGLK